MASEVIKLNLIPKGEMPVFHASQFDTGRLITCELYRGEDAYSVPEGYTVELHCRKVDNNIVTMASTFINDNVITFTSTEQLTACNGNNLCEVVILDEGYRIGTLNFILEVEIDPLKGGINSTSEIHNLEEQIEEIATEIIGEDYYNKSEVDGLLADKANAADVYTKSQVDSALALKANAADVYTKSQVDSALALKANAADVYTKSQVDSALALKANAADVYTKQEVDNIIMDIMPVDTASGATATFDTEIAAPLVNVSCNIVATGGYDADTQTAHPINGYTEANITRCGVNLLHVNSRVSQTTAQVIYTSDDNYIEMNGTKYGGTYADLSALTVTLPAGTYYLKAFEISGTATNAPSITAYNGSDLTSNILNNERTLTLSAPTTFRFRFALWTDNAVYTNYKIGIAISTASISEYSEYTGNTYTIAFGQTVYGGVLDVTRGKLTVENVKLTLNGTEAWGNYPAYNGVSLVINNMKSGNFMNGICSHFAKLLSHGHGIRFGANNNLIYCEEVYTDISGVTDVDSWKTWLSNNNIDIVYPLDTPFDIDLTPEVISAVVGTNNVYSDTNGDTTVQYKDSIQHYIDKHIGG